MATRDDNCLQTLIKAGFTPDKAEDHLDAVQSRAEMYQGKGIDEPQAISMAVKDILGEETKAAQQQRLNALNNLRKRTDRDTRTNEGISELRKGGDLTAKNIFDSYNAMLTGIYQNIKNAKFSLAADVENGQRERLGGFLKDLGETKLTKIAQKGTYDDDVAKEMTNPGSTKNKQAQQIAEILKNYSKLSMDGVNKEGAWISDLKDYMIRNEHNWQRISDAGYDDWRGDVLKWLKPNVTLAGMDKPRIEQFIKNNYNALVSGEFFVGGKVGMKDPVFTGPGNIAKKLSKERVLHFSDEGWYEYWKKYGTSSSLTESVQNTIMRGAKDESLMRWFGTNAEADFKNDLTRIQQTYSGQFPEVIRSFQEDRTDGGALPSYKQRLQNRFDEVSGRGQMPANKLATNIGMAIRTFETITKLGKVPFAHVSILPTRALAAHSFGDSAVSAMGDSLKALFDKGDKVTCDLLGASNDGFISHFMGAYNEGFTGAASTINNLMMRITGIRYIMDANRTRSEFTLSHFLGSNLDKSFDELPGMTSKELSAYGIQKEDWEALRGAQDPHMLSGRKYLTPDLARRTTVPGEAQEGLERKLSMMFGDYSRRAMNIPGAEARSLLYRDLPFHGQIGKAMAQFKQWPVELMINAFGRTVYDNPTTQQKMMGAFVLAAGLTSSGYIRLALNNISSGIAPPDPTSYKTFLESAQSGGAATVLADTLSSLIREKQYDEAVVGTLAGPSGKDMWDLGKIGFRAAQGEKNQGRALEEYGLKHIPLQNLWYTQLLTNYMYLWNLHEQIHPGWSDRYENYIQQDTGNKPFIGPTNKY